MSLATGMAKRRRMLSFIVTVVVTIAVLAVLVRLVEPRFAFFPMAGEQTTPAEFGVGFDAAPLQTSDGERLRVWRLPQPAARARILYFHGNGGNLSVWAPILSGIAREGYSVFAFDYRGYGRSSGRPTERGLYRDVDAVLDQDWGSAAPAAPLVYWGRSLGATMAAYAAARKPPDGLILESGFPDVRTLVRTSPPLALLALFSTYRFPTAEYLRTVSVPVLVMHGDRDSVIPFRLGQALFDRIHGPKRFVVIRGGDHNDLAPPDPHAYWTAVGEFIAGLKVPDS